jgi:hypothetical protein
MRYVVSPLTEQATSKLRIIFANYLIPLGVRD